MSRETCHSWACYYTVAGTTYSGKKYLSTNVLAGDVTITKESLIARWNVQAAKRNVYTLGADIDIDTAINIVNKNGVSIKNSYKLLDHLPYHSVEISCIESEDQIIQS